MDFLEYPDITAEVKGAMMPGRLKMTDQALIFKNQKTGKVEQISASDMEMVNFQKFVSTWGLRIFLKNGTLHRFRGFKDGEREKIAKFFNGNYKKDMLEKELSLKGWNWGTAKFHGSVLSFDVGHNTAFEIPLNNVSQCTTGKNEVTLEFHQNDDAPVSLLEMRFHIPVSDNSDKDPVEQFHKEVMDKASVINVSGESVALFREIQCLTPRGRYDITIFQTFFQLHGKTFDYKIPMSTVLRLFLLPHKDNRQMFFVVSLDPPIKQGQTRYHYLVLLFNQDDEVTIELPFSEEDIKERYEDKLTKEMTGPTYEIMGKVMKVIINRKLIGPGSFQGTSNTPAIGCSYKAAAGYLYPLERGFMYVHKPPIHIRFDEISSVNFARSGGSTRSFDFEIELTTGTIHTFSSIEKGEYDKLFDYINAKKLRVKNRGKGEKSNYNDDFGGSDDEAEPDAYLARVKAEAQERDEGDDDDDDESTDEDFKPAAEESDVAEEYDSNPNDTSDSDNDSDASGGSGKKDKEKKKKEKKPKSAKTVSEKPRKPRKQKKEKDENKPKRPPSAYMLYLNSVREEIKSKHPGIKVTEIAQKGGEMWKELKDKTKWEEKANKLKEEWQESMKEYKASGGGASSEPKEKSKSEKKPAKKKESPKESPVKAQSGSFKSKEYISDDDSSSDDDSKKKSDKKRKASSSDESDASEKEEKSAKGAKKQKKKSESEDSDVESEEEASSGGSESD